MRNRRNRSHLERVNRWIYDDWEIRQLEAFHESVRVLGGDTRHGSRRRFRNTNRWSCQRPYLRFAMGWRRRCQPTSSLGMWLVYMCDSPFLLVNIPDPNLLKLCLRLRLTKVLLPHHPSRDFATSSSGKLMKKWVNRIGRCLGGLIIRPRAEHLLRTVPDY